MEIDEGWTVGEAIKVSFGLMFFSWVVGAFVVLMADVMF